MTAETFLAPTAVAQNDRTLPASIRAALSVLKNIEGGSLRLRLPDGRSFAFGDGNGPNAEIDIRDYRFARRVLFNGDIGFSEGWIEGEWTSPDLARLLTLLAGNAERLMGAFTGGPLAILLDQLARLRRRNSRRGARRNIIAHYDLGNAFFAEWLDQTMTYSSARFENDAEDLEAAQHAKYRAIAEGARLKPGDRVLEIGCGWGGFAEFAAREFGANVVALTISDEQYAFARDRIARGGLDAKVEIRRQDYRDVEGQFDVVVSIEMLEAVGERYWPIYFAKLAHVLKPGGRAVLQVITIRDDLFAGYRRRVDFVQHSIFPGGLLPSVVCLRAQACQAGLSWESMESFGADYDTTLTHWTRRFEQAWPAIEQQGFNDRFRRFWMFYLAYCTAGFRTKRTDVVQLILDAPHAGPSAGGVSSR
jgi:cyclopropane-fatty-acyl-phospholipid synthase